MVAVKTMADERLRSILSHLSPPLAVTVTSASESPPAAAAGRSDLGRSGQYLFECEGPKSAREEKLLQNLILSRLRRFEECDAAALRLVPCRGEFKSQDMAEEYAVLKLETRELENRVPTETDEEEPSISEGDGSCDRQSVRYDGEREEQVRSEIASASAVGSSGAIDGQLKVMVEKNKSVSHFRVAACKFCDVIQGIAPCFKLYEDELCLCILDVNPLNVGHSLILPKSHFPCLEATPPQVAAAMCAAVPLISRALLAATRCDSFNMLVNNGVAAGQVIMHTHFHIIPRCKGDGLWKSEGSKRRPLRKVQEANLLAHAVRARLSSTVGSVTQ